MIKVKSIQFPEKKILKNFVALALVQATNFIIPLITLPYLVRTIGFEHFGTVSYALTIMTYASIVIDYGFSMSATRQVAIHRDNKEKLSAIFSTVTSARLLLFLIIAAGVLVMTIFVERFRQDQLLYLYGLTFPLGIALMPTWLYQGLEQMRQITYLNITAKIITIGLLFGVVRDPTDFIYILSIYGIANVVSGIHSLYRVVNKNGLIFRIPRIAQLKQQYKSGFNLFMTSITVGLVNNVNILILAEFVDNGSLGSYGLAEKIIFAVWQILVIFSTTIYPTLCRLAQESHELLRIFIGRTFLPFTVCVLLGCIGISIFSEDIIHLIAKKANPEAVVILRIMIFVPFVVCLNIPTYQTQLAYSITRENTRIYGYAAVLNLLICMLLSSIWGARGAAVAMLIVQTFVTIALYMVTEVKFKQYSLLRWRFQKQGSV